MIAQQGHMWDWWQPACSQTATSPTALLLHAGILQVHVVRKMQEKVATSAIAAAGLAGKP
jgi:hypothetical protein